MPKRKIDLGVKVQAMLECLQLHNVDAVMDKYGLSKRAAYYWFEKIKARLPEILQEGRPGPKGALPETETPPRLLKTSDKR